MISNPTYDSLQTVLERAGRLVQCSSSSSLNSDSATEVSSDDGNIIALFRISQLNEAWSGSVTERENSTLRRALTNAQNACGVVFDRLPTSIANQSNLLLTIEYNNYCSNYNTSICNSQNTIDSVPKCCEISISYMYMDSSGSINVRDLQIDSSQNGQGTLTLPFDSCNENVKCAYYDETNQCWSYDGLSRSDDCSSCTTTHFSTFAYVSSTTVETSNPILGCESDDCFTEPAPTFPITTEQKSETSRFLNIYIYVFIVFNIYLIILSIVSTMCSKRNRVYSVNDDVRPSSQYIRNHSKRLPDDSRACSPQNSDKALGMKAKPFEENKFERKYS